MSYISIDPLTSSSKSCDFSSSVSLVVSVVTVTAMSLSWDPAELIDNVEL